MKQTICFKKILQWQGRKVLDQIRTLFFFTSNEEEGEDDDNEE
jgi:hypothetical protein